MIRIAISPAAFDAIAATLPLGSVGYEAQANAKGERLIWLESAAHGPAPRRRELLRRHPAAGRDRDEGLTRLAIR
jgi:hypothetical protein